MALLTILGSTSATLATPSAFFMLDVNDHEWINQVSISQSLDSPLDIFIPETTGATVSYRIELAVSELLRVDILSYPQDWRLQTSVLNETQLFTFLYAGSKDGESELYNMVNPWLMEFKLEEINDLVEGTVSVPELRVFGIAKNTMIPSLTPIAINYFDTVNAVLIPEPSQIALFLGVFVIVGAIKKRIRKCVS